MCAIVQRDDRERLAAAGNLAVSLWHRGKHDEAEKMEREVLAVRKRVLGAEHPKTLGPGRRDWKSPERKRK